MCPSAGFTNVERNDLLLRTTGYAEGVPFKVTDFRNGEEDVLTRIVMEGRCFGKAYLHHRFTDNTDGRLARITKERHVDFPNK
mmetsp:Transcript_18372/g.21172  ORF Transcript_18372/g.21172 Transcript_18372/m.21172 type:complete len:83 (+) Transcript_18372:157-405(+)